MKILNWLFVFAGIVGLVSVRILEEKLFYDPFLSYFHEANKHIAIPNFEWGRLIFGYIFRFLLNLFFSCIIIQFLFKNKQWTIQGGILVIIIFAITFPIYLLCIQNQFEVGYLFSFYMRRFVIQPMVLLLIIPLFYYRKNLAKEN